MEAKYCKQCNAEITHNKKRRLCTECLKKEYNESSKYYYYKNKYSKSKVKKVKKIKTGICKCGNKIEHNYKRLICSDCIREENRNNYNKNRDKYYAARKSKREKLKDTRFCVICKIEFKTAHAIKCTCSFECSKTHRRRLSLDNYYSKKVNKSNTK
mgnify:CR=1 FL=1